MIAFDEDALICDLAETYQIYDYKQLPANKVAVFSVGLRNDSRIKLALSGQKASTELMLLAGVFDRLGFLAWAKTKDAQTGQNRPISFLDTMIGDKSEPLLKGFENGEDFEKEWKRIVNKKGGND